MSSSGKLSRICLRSVFGALVLTLATACGKREDLEAKVQIAKAALEEQRTRMDQLRKEAEAVFARKRAPSTTQKEQELQKVIEDAKARKATLDRELEQARESLKKLQNDHQDFRKTHLKA